MLELLMFILVALIALCFGAFLIWAPLKAFEVQKKFYSFINWNIEPISLQKEIRNTKAMGLFLVVFVIIACAFKWFRWLTP